MNIFIHEAFHCICGTISLAWLACSREIIEHLFFPKKHWCSLGFILPMACAQMWYPLSSFLFFFPPLIKKCKLNGSIWISFTSIFLPQFCLTLPVSFICSHCWSSSLEPSLAPALTADFSFLILMSAANWHKWEISEARAHRCFLHIGRHNKVPKNY